MVWVGLPPREKLVQCGVKSLTNSELLAIFLRTGGPDCSVLALAERLLDEFGSLYHLLQAEMAAFAEIKGIGVAKFCQLQAVAELAKRFFSSSLFLQEEALLNPELTRDFLFSLLSQREREIFVVIFLDNQHRVLNYQEMFAGTIDSVEVHPREVLKQALKTNAAALIIAHNHPSGYAEPSQSDRRITDQIAQACQLFDIRLLDHLVIGKGEAISFAERGWL